MALAICIFIFFQARKDALPGDRYPFSLSHVWISFKRAVIPLGMPIIIFGGILGGVTTATEAAVLAVLYGFIVSVFIYKEVSYSEVGRMLVNTGVVTGVILILIATADLLWIMANQQIPELSHDSCSPLENRGSSSSLPALLSSSEVLSSTGSQRLLFFIPYCFRLR
jgi:C4-dicarboxylate transporter DctM subunit